MATITIDNRPYQVKDGQNLLHACLSLGFDLPYFCWHPAMHSVGACRQCAVKQFRDEKDTQGRIVMACMTPATDGVRISIDDPEARRFRAGVIEFLMTNHPHDCPVCDEGGECHLQDMTVMTGHTYRRYRFGKRTHRNQNLGPLVNHEMNRCIACYRCVRFYRDYAGGRDFDVFQWHHHVYFGRYTDGVLQSEFSGNLVEICPTGVFTDKTFKKHYTRSWDLQTAPSICTHCGLGCNTIAGERYGTLRRIRNRYNPDVNGYFLCDRGRYGYEFVNDPRRIRRPMLRVGRSAPAELVTKQAALEHAAALLRSARGVLGIGSPRASLEDNFALRELVGPKNFFCGMSEADARLASTMIDILRRGPAPTPTLDEVRRADAVLVLGEDLPNTAPLLALNVRQSTYSKAIHLAKRLHIQPWDDAAVSEAMQQQRGPLYIAGLTGGRLDDAATAVYRAAPDDLVRFGLAVAHALDAKMPPIDGLSDADRALVKKIAKDLFQAERPLIVSGAGCGSEALLRTAAAVAWSLRAQGHSAHLFFSMPECNSLGMGLICAGCMGAARQKIRAKEADTLIVLENDLWRRDEDQAVRELFDGVEHVIAIDALDTPTTAQADVVLPAAAFAETDGTLVNSEGRAQRFYQVFKPEGEIQAGWRWIGDLAAAMGKPSAAAWKNFDEVGSAMVEALPVFGPLRNLAPPAGFRIVGQPIPRQSHRYSGRTAVHAAQSVREPRPPADPDSPLAFSMEGYPGQPPPPLIPRYWAPGWNSVQSVTRYQVEVGGPLRGGESGKRLIEPFPIALREKAGRRDEGEDKEMTIVLHPQPLSHREKGVEATAPEPFIPRPAEWLAIPLFHVFGSEELSVHSPGIAELMPRPYLAICPADAEKLAVCEGDALAFSLDGTTHRLPVKIHPTLAAGCVGVPAGLPNMPYVSPLQWIELHKAATGGRG